jgi:hypothetical protein
MLIRTLLPFILVFLLQLPSLAESELIPFQLAREGSYFVSPRLMLDTAEFDTLVIRLRAEQGGPARLFFTTSYDDRFNRSKSIAFSLKKGERDYYLNLAARNPNWMGWLTGLVLEPEGGEGRVALRSARITKGRIFTDLRSGWQEFWELETIKARTVNIIKGHTILGRQVNYYVYFIIGLAFLFLAGRQVILSRKKGFMAIWQAVKERMNLLVILALVLAVLMEVRLWFDYIQIASVDYRTFWGKTLDEKRDLTMGGGFYNFLNFCNKVLPERAEVELSFIGNFYRSRGPYYLYPHRVSNDAPYLIVFHKEVAKKRLKDYSLFAKFKSGEYILKKK